MSYPQVGVRGFGQELFKKEAVEGTQTTYKTFNRLFDGAIVLSQVKGWEGAIGVCEAEHMGWYVSPEYRTFHCLPGQASPEYLRTLFSVPWFWSQLKHLSRGVGGRRERTRPEHFLSMRLPMPSLQQQEQAVRMFASLKQAKHFQEQSRPQLDALLPSILDKAFKGEL